MHGGRYVSTRYKSWRITHDAAGKVVVRSVADDGKETVIAVAKWKPGGGLFTVDRAQTNPGVPSKPDWSMIETEIYRALEVAHESGMGPDPRLDNGTLPGEPGKAAKAEVKDTKPTPFGWVLTILILGGLGVGVYFGWPYIKPLLGLIERTGKANGEACNMDMDCRSDVCDYGRCAAGKRAKGDRCDFDGQCKSDECRAGLCD